MQFYPFTPWYGVYEMSITFFYLLGCIDSLFVAVAAVPAAAVADVTVNNVTHRESICKINMCLCTLYNNIISACFVYFSLKGRARVCACMCLYFSVHHLIMTLISLDIVVYLALFSSGLSYGIVVLYCDCQE